MNDLIEILRDATGPLDDETIGRVISAIKGVPFAGVRNERNGLGNFDLVVDAVGEPDIWADEKTPDQSIDAVITLAEQAFPGWLWKMGTCCVSDDAWICPDFNSPEHGERLRKQFGDYKQGSPLDVGFDVDRRPPTGRPCLAMLEAMLMAREFVNGFVLEQSK